MSIDTILLHWLNWILSRIHMLLRVHILLLRIWVYMYRLIAIGILVRWYGAFTIRLLIGVSIMTLSILVAILISRVHESVVLAWALIVRILVIIVLMWVLFVRVLVWVGILVHLIMLLSHVVTTRLIGVQILLADQLTCPVLNGWTFAHDGS
jgi:hypothetical protein